MKRTPMRRTPFRRKEGPTTRPVREWTGEYRPERPRAVMARCDGQVRAAAKGPEPVRDESYRRWVASLPCYECRIEGYSNAAHPNSGKAKGVKLTDEGCFPLCVDRPEVKGCHPKFDQYEIVSAEEMPEYERAALEWTRQQGAKA